MTMHIRPCAAGEELSLLAVFQSSVRGLASRDYTPEQIDAWATAVMDEDSRMRWIARIQSNRPWVAEVDRRLAGFADLQPDGCIDQFFVAAEFSGQGVGTALMRHLHELARSQGITELFSHVSLTAQPFFRHAGFRVESEQYPVVRGIALRNAVMRKSLNKPS
ncbi:GNAT family N-acetyltransferase [Massilia sp. IC2-477]|uniref:GNAT family N-acetyltransferase n=1 Tax=Massilia sp. IC2-477 TaxID=2887198 RepID=UPI001D12E715|nr:GNAT family N-acetyltransferase [Massilia sp. IC2-477]